ncbi:uncharacterized protein N7500_005215 [Penicillium coprophilum]|uniref:uncharacterized protein n=1 Tax=Penicillium coprophilum TaxID=36646 RepID=UPI002392DD43|nr:uncharacterized protein N7500_005215 [Penicillium coprophilum]KAJ5163385.1 hypothetical protein N7500_005215 [Penicillium coprophilum]
MPPMFSKIERTLNESISVTEFSAQWKTPSDIFSVLLILGGDIVSRALAQLAGSRLTPVAFSFGWVAFAVTTVVAVVGEKKLMPPADFPCKVINGETGYIRDNRSWIIGRLVRDFDNWMDKQPRVHAQPNVTPDSNPKPVQKCVQEITDAKWKVLKEIAKEKKAARARAAAAQRAIKSYPGYDAPYITGILTTIVQLGISAIPFGLSGNWGIFLVTAAGIVLSFSTGALSQWSKEKWACRSSTTKTFVLTPGNGSQHAIVIQSNGTGFDLEDLAANDPGMVASYKTRVTITALGAMWIILLITAAGIQQDTWFLLAVGALGILQNVYAAGVSRLPMAFGVHLEFVEVIGESKVMDALFRVEHLYPCLGKSLLPVFFPGELDEQEQVKWKGFDDIAKLKRKSKKQKKERAASHQKVSQPRSEPKNK